MPLTEQGPDVVEWFQARVTEDRRGDQVTTFGGVDPFPLPGAWVQQTASNEASDDRGATVTISTLFCKEPRITFRDRFRWEARMYEVAGQPRHLRSPGGYSHTEVTLTLVEG